MPTSRQLFDKLEKAMRAEHRKGKTVDQICAAADVKKALHEYNTKSGFVINAYRLRQYAKRVCEKGGKSARKSARKPRKSVRKSVRKPRKVFKSRKSAKKSARKSRVRA
jgi:hypothetical protein